MNGMELNSIRSLRRGNHSRPGVAAILSLKKAQQRIVRQTAARKALGADERKPARLAVLGTNSSTAIYVPLLRPAGKHFAPGTAPLAQTVLRNLSAGQRGRYCPDIPPRISHACGAEVSLPLAVRPWALSASPFAMR